MKALIILFFLLLTAASSKSQNVQDSLAYKIAERMKDSLSLSDLQKAKLYIINMQLNKDKAATRNLSVNGDYNYMRKQMQAIENTRDSIYSQVLTNEQLRVYKQNKNKLVHNN